MPRKTRQISNTGIYHIIVRGINRQDIFHDVVDYSRYLETLQRIITKKEVHLLGYCLMTNHVHLLIDEGSESISSIMKRLGTSYAHWYNCKYERVGHVFQDRFKSESVEDDVYLKTVIRYIHQNPVKVGITKQPQTYRWSSCAVYCGGKEYLSGLTETDFILSLFSDNEDNAIKQFCTYMDENSEDRHLDHLGRKHLNDKEAEQLITEALNGKPLSVLAQMPKKERDEILMQLKQVKGLSLRQISRLTGIGTTTIHNAQSEQYNRPLVH